MLHQLKTWVPYFIAVFEGTKTFEIRKNDRNFKVGDLLELQEYDHEKREFTDRLIMVEVIYVLHGPGFGIEEGYCVMGIKRVNIFQRIFKRF